MRGGNPIPALHEEAWDSSVGERSTNDKVANSHFLGFYQEATNPNSYTLPVDVSVPGEIMSLIVMITNFG